MSHGAPGRPAFAGRLVAPLAGLGLACASFLHPAPAAATQPFVRLELLVGAAGQGRGFEMAQGVAIDPRRGEFAIANSGHGRIEILRSNGQAAASFEHRVRGGDGSFVAGQPRAVCYDAAGRLLVGDNLDPCIDVLDFRGRVIERRCLPAIGGAAPADTTVGAMARARDGSILVATRGDPARIHRFDTAGRWAGSWGEAGRGPGQLSRVTAIAETPQGGIVVACGGTELVVQCFDRDGGFVTGFGRHEMGPGNFSHPSGLAVTEDGRIWVSDEIRHSVQVFDAGGRYLGTAGQGGIDPGAFLFPSGIAVDDQGRLAVIERVGARLQVFRVLDPAQAFRIPEGR